METEESQGQQQVKNWKPRVWKEVKHCNMDGELSEQFSQFHREKNFKKNWNMVSN